MVPKQLKNQSIVSFILLIIDVTENQKINKKSSRAKRFDPFRVESQRGSSPFDSRDAYHGTRMKASLREVGLMGA